MAANTSNSNRRGACRGLRNKRSPSQQGLGVDPVAAQQQQQQRSRISAGSYLGTMLIHQDSSTREPQFLAAPSVHSTTTASPRDSFGNSSLSSFGSSSRRVGLRANRESMIRKVSESSLTIHQGSGHSSDKSIEDSLLDTAVVARPGLDREVSGLFDSSRSFFCDDAVMTTTATSSLLDHTTPVAYNQVQQQEPAARPDGRRTFEDMSMEAQHTTSSVQELEQEQHYEMEISPGVYLPFRGAQETWRAVDCGTALETTCLECGLALMSVPDCQCVVCSDCKMVNPIFDHPAGIGGAIHGVGMGLQKDWVQERQRQAQDYSRRPARYY